MPGSLSLAWQIGLSVMTAQAAKLDPVAAVLQLYQGSGRLLFSGKVTGVVRHTEAGFVRGAVRISSRAADKLAIRDAVPGRVGGTNTGDSSSGSVADRALHPAAHITTATAGGEACSGVTATVDGDLLIEFQNENLVARTVAGCVLACVPDLICILETGSGLAVATEEVRYGLWVSVVALPAHPLLRTDAALKVVGPAAFGYSTDKVTYVPVGAFPVIPTVHDSCEQEK